MVTFSPVVVVVMPIIKSSYGTATNQPKGADNMNVNKLPKLLDRWLDNRGFVWGKRHAGNALCLNEDEIYSAAVECLSDCDECGNLWSGERASDIATLRRFVEREGRTHDLLPLKAWYNKGC